MWIFNNFLFFPADTLIHNQRIHTIRKGSLGILRKMHPNPICGIAYSLLKILYIHFLYFFHVLLPSIKKGQLQTSVCKLPYRCYNVCSFLFCFCLLLCCLSSASLATASIFRLCSITSVDASSVT